MILLCDALGRYNIKSDEGIFLGYSLHVKAYGVFNKRTKVIEESLHLRFDEVFISNIVNDNWPPLHDLSLNENTNVRVDPIV